MNPRLRVVEVVPAQFPKILNTTKALTGQVTASQEAESQSLAKVNDLEKQLMELKALKPPASQSSDTLLNEREKSLLDTPMSQAKADGSPSLIDRMIGGQPTAATVAKA